MMFNLHTNLLTAVISTLTTVASCQGNVFEAIASKSQTCTPAATREEGAVAWHGHAKWLDVRSVGGAGRVHIRTAASGDEIEVHARSKHVHDTPFVLLALPHGHGVTVCAAPAGSTEGAPSCPSGARDWPEHLVPAIDLEVSVPEGVSVHAAGAAT